MPDQSKAKQILLEIVRVAGGKLRNKTNLFKAFYFAHLYYAKDNPDYLSDWPIVRMPNGPGIDASERLIGDLVREGEIEVVTVPVGPFVAQEYRLVNDSRPELSLGAIDAIRRGTQLVVGKDARSLSNLTHEYSRSWMNAANGEELNIYLDLLSDEEFQRSHEETLEIVAALKGFTTSDTMSRPSA
jgi:hypothetical protein